MHIRAVDIFTVKSRSMSLSTALETRSNNSCELCYKEAELSTYLVEPRTGQSDDDYAVICSTCVTEMQKDSLSEDHWRGLNESIWSTVPAVQVLSYRLLTKINKSWTQDLINMMYMEENTMEWAQSSLGEVIHKDCNGHVLHNGDSVTLIKDLNVKGAGFTAKRGTAVRRISLDQDNSQHIHGRINDQTIVILTQYVKKS